METRGYNKPIRSEYFMFPCSFVTITDDIVTFKFLIFNVSILFIHQETFTLILKGVIGLAMAKFPPGTYGKPC